MFRPGDTVRYRRRIFVVVRVVGSKITLRDDEGETFTVSASQVFPV